MYCFKEFDYKLILGFFIYCMKAREVDKQAITVFFKGTIIHIVTYISSWVVRHYNIEFFLQNFNQFLDIYFSVAGLVVFALIINTFILWFVSSHVGDAKIFEIVATLFDSEMFRTVKDSKVKIDSVFGEGIEVLLTTYSGDFQDFSWNNVEFPFETLINTTNKNACGIVLDITEFPKPTDGDISLFRVGNHMNQLI